MKNLILIVAVILLSISKIIGQNNQLTKDKNSIKKMCGCFDVTFNFAETFSYSEDSTYRPSDTKHASALELAELITDEDGKVSIQHLLIVGPPSNPMTIKHWRQDWLYENTDFYMFNADNKWSYTKKSKSEVSGQWTQKVYQVDDSPRYEGSGTWVHVDGKSYWESTTTAPLPRREYTQRSDYNLTLRRNRHEITKNGWVHDQDNDKIIRNNDNDELIAQEKGYNTYVRVDDSKCESAKTWWKENEIFWENAREMWDSVYGRNINMELASKVDGKRLYEILFEMELDSKPREIKKVIESFLIK
ncbi:MAG: hypothetical protein MK105_13160 [Crocinitomicaceae bacterium]|nr:hypothetical protein [Crocinitomicaceae bacterium]